MKLSALAIMAGILLTNAAHAENIIRISAPIKFVMGEGPADAWVAAEPLRSEWEFNSYLFCSVTPAEADMPLGKFERYKTCNELRTRTSQAREYNTVSHKYRNVGEPETQEDYNSKTVTKLYSTNDCRYDVTPGGAGNFWQKGAMTGGNVLWSWENQVREIVDGYVNYMDSTGNWERGVFQEMAADGVTSLYSTCMTEYEPWW